MMKQRSMARVKRVAAAAARAAAFSRALATRHAPQRQASPVDAVLLRRASPLLAIHAMQQHWQLTIAPHLQLLLASSSPARATEPPAAPAPFMVQPPAARPTFVSQVLEPIRLRSERVDTLRVLQQTLQAAAARPAARAEAIAAAPPPAHIERVFHSIVRTAAAAATAAAAPVAHHDVALAARTAPDTRTFGPATPVAAAADIDIGRLADRVVHAIDRRLVAQRERHGRI